MISRFIKSNRVDRYNSALDALRTNVMIADENLNITYMNPSLYEFMKEAELDLRVELPRFRLNALIGSNIDIFHKDPSHQRRMLQALRKPYSATIRVGPRIFDLLVTPLLSNSRPSGYVVEWSDAKERLLNLDYAGQIAAIGRSQAMVEFSIEGKIVGANRIFLDTMGYELDELLGQEDTIFLDTDQQIKQEHTDLWKRLMSGEFQSGQFKRMHKNGNAIWIEGTYNPILDVRGQICKIVQFSSDATNQVKLLDNLKVLIDRNFFEIDEAVMLSATEAEQAEQAATHTSSSVQSVAAAAEELASSINEISSSMSNARQISDDAQEQLKAAGDLTQKLTSTTDSMSSVINMISSIASQINLLALNATIEAARAGAAGRGFAVVAAEVKNLATQAARATEQIESQIANAQGVSAQVAQNLHGILRSVESVRSHVTATATSVEEQSAVTHDMSHTMQETAGRVNIITKSIAEISRSVSRVSETVGNTKAAAIILSR